VRFARDSLVLTGFGQTVVVVDSGIAYDHVALGGGWGPAHRVVGGWDFAENDANPYDDGPQGLHGTHVAGIIAASDATYPGMAPEVDLVALRVFDDQGQATFERMERALRWVHEHRASFEHPITVVNISIGSDWNGSQAPSWGVLEDELAQLASDGMIITASAGNDFQTYQQAGLSYPAASSHVLPVGSVNAAGDLSSFSQRHTRMTAAWGEWITSTAPDYLFGFNGVTDDFVELSGTSVAAPVVAGASVLVREAMRLIGANATATAAQSLIRDTADWIFDAATSQSYRRLDLAGALQSAIGQDEHSGPADPTFLGVLSEELQRQGVLQSATDEDYLRFQVQEPGRVRVQLEWMGRSHHRPQLAGLPYSDTGVWEFDVQPGQYVDLGIVARGGIGRYQLRLTMGSSTTPEAADVSISESRVQWTATDTGLQVLTVVFADSQSVHELSVRDVSGQLLSQVLHPRPEETVSVNVLAGQSYEVVIRGIRSTALIQIGNTGGRNGPGSGHGWAPDSTPTQLPALSVAFSRACVAKINEQWGDARPASSARETLKTDGESEFKRGSEHVILEPVRLLTSDGDQAEIVDRVWERALTAARPHPMMDSSTVLAMVRRPPAMRRPVWEGVAGGSALHRCCADVPSGYAGLPGSPADVDARADETH
jgi:hypothetical protein